MYKEYIEEYKKISSKIEAEFADESISIKSQESKRLRISKYFENMRVDFMAIDHKITYHNKVCYSRPYSGIYIPVENKYDYNLEVISKFGFDFLKKIFDKKYTKSGYSDFNKKFLIKCNEPLLLSKVLKHEETRCFLKKNQSYKLGLTKKDVTFTNRSTLNQDFLYIEQDHWVNNPETINKLLNIAGKIIIDLTSSRLVEIKTI